MTIMLNNLFHDDVGPQDDLTFEDMVTPLEVTNGKTLYRIDGNGAGYGVLLTTKTDSFEIVQFFGGRANYDARTTVLGPFQGKSRSFLTNVVKRYRER